MSSIVDRADVIHREAGRPKVTDPTRGASAGRQQDTGVAEGLDPRRVSDDDPARPIHRSRQRGAELAWPGAAFIPFSQEAPGVSAWWR